MLWRDVRAAELHDLLRVVGVLGAAGRPQLLRHPVRRQGRDVEPCLVQVYEEPKPRPVVRLHLLDHVALRILVVVARALQDGLGALRHEIRMFPAVAAEHPRPHAVSFYDVDELVERMPPEFVLAAVHVHRLPLVFQLFLVESDVHETRSLEDLADRKSTRLNSSHLA